MADSRVFVCVSSALVESARLVELAPVPIVTGSTRLKKRSEDQPFRPSHIHLFEDERETTDEISAQFEHTADWLAEHFDGLRRYRRLVPVKLSTECHYESTFDLRIANSTLRTLARLRMEIDVDLFWANDWRVEELPGNFWPRGVLRIHTNDDWSTPWRWGVEHGRLMAPVLRKLPTTAVELTFEERGGYGRPISHFSANSVALLAKAGSSLRIKVEPGWPLLPNTPPE